MTEHLSSHTIELLIDRRLEPEDLLSATRHLATCSECRDKASEVAGVLNRVQYLRNDLQLAVAETQHPGYEQLEAYVDDSLTVKDRETVKRHLASCPDCLREARELESLRDNLKTYPALSGVTVVSRERRESFWEKLAGLLQTRPRQLAFLAAALVLIAVITVLLIRRPAPQQIVNKNSAPRNTSEANHNSQVADANTNAANGNQETPKGPGEVAAASSYEGIVKQTIEAQKITAPAVIRDLTGKESKLLGSVEKQDRFALLSPVATLIRSNRPTFRWQKLPGATSYSVAILDLDLNLIEKSSPASRLSWTTLHGLKRNVVYIWQVTALKDGREITAPAAPAREARFKVLSSERAAILSRVSTEMAGSHLKLGIIYAHDGLLDDAEREFRAAIAANQDAALARKLLQSARQMRK